MGAWGTRLHLSRIAGVEIDDVEGALRDLFYALREAILERLYALIDVGSIGGLDAYLSSEDFHTWLSDRFEPSADDSEIFFAFWDDDELRVPEYTRHCFDVVIAHADKALDPIVRARGFAIDRTKHVLADAMADRFLLAPTERGAFIVEAAPWCRGQPIDAPSRLLYRGPDSLGLVERASRQVQRALQAIAMTGRCLCPLCTVVREQRRMDPLKPAAKIAMAWELLENEPTGAALAADPSSGAVLADWLEERGVVLVPELRDGLAATFRTATPYAAPVYVVIVLHEDTYETRVGDGYFAYFSAAFRDRAQAEQWIVANRDSKRGDQIAYHLREAVLEPSAHGWQFMTELRPREHASLSDVLAALGLPAVPQS